SSEQLIIHSTNYIRSLLLIKNGVTKDSLLGNSVERFSENVLSSWSTVQVERALSIFLQLYRDIRYSISPRYEIELAFSRLCWLSEYVSPQEVKLAIEQARSLLLKENHDGTNGNQALSQQYTSPQNSNSKTAYVNPYTSKMNESKTESNPFAARQVTTNPTGVTENVSSQNVANVQSPSLPSGGPADRQSIGAFNSSHESNQSVQAISNSQNFQSAKEISISELRNAVINALSQKDSLTASALMQTGEWILQGNSIFAKAENAYQRMQIDRQKQNITSIISNLYGSPLQFNIELAEKTTPQEQEIPEQVKILKNAFMGSVVGGKQ
ncbi:MAG: hypothetical protein IJR49_03975, partial [Treponema sp.]|nr:hypothetical protein [Treponema sp.]